MTKILRRQFSVRFKNTVDQRVLEFANCQSNFTDTILYLIENEVAKNGIRNIQEHVPVVRDLLSNEIAAAESIRVKTPKVSKDDLIKFYTF